MAKNTVSDRCHKVFAIVYTLPSWENIIKSDKK